MKTTFTSSVTRLVATFTAALLVTAPAAQAVVIADSVGQFSGVQGNNGWYYGYRNVTTDGAGTNYDAAAHVILFAGGEGAGAWDGATQFWTGSAWDLNTAGAAPWTFIAQTNIHPNGLNNVNEHWAIRRWTGDQLDAITPVAITWFMRKQSAAGNGVSGGIYTNGVRVDWTAIAGTNTAGVTRTYYVNAHFGMNIDLVLGPVGPDGVNHDGSDGSFNWMTVDNTIPAVPRQPDGTIFIPHNAPDTDADSLPDIWENAYAPGNLARFNATTDDDGDGSNETQEFQRGTDPTDTDTDNDGLSDGVETNTGTFVNATDTGTSPRLVDTDGDGRGDGAELTQAPFSNPTLADTDGDGFSDGSEVSTGHNPNDPGHNPNTTWIAHSQTEFSGVQGQEDWFYGYRNVTLDAAGLTSYDPTNHFIPFPEGSFTGSLWDLNTAATGPWTELGAEATHPNGVNSAPNQEHWTVRRWIANELTGETPLTLIWHMRKSNLNGSASNGVTGAIFINGRIADTATILYNNGVGVTRRYYVNAKPGDIIDLILSPRGFDNVSADGADGSANRLVVDPAIPPNPIQPDGTPFVPATSPDNDFDTLPDAWEMVYFPGDLTRLTGTGDFDSDGLNDRGEYLRDSNPTIPDTDGDGLLDRVETNTGTFVDANNTGTNPRSTDTDADGISDSNEVNGTPRTNPNRSDSDSDGFSDPVELAEGTNPNDPADNPLTFVIAASDREFSGVQGSNNWFNGYRNYTTDGGGTDYDPTANFIPYEGGEGLGAWGPGQYWNGGAWDLNTGGSGPWTSQGAQATHPNGVNSAPNQEHWAIRRWVATELTNPTPAAIIWRVWKGNASGGGVSGAIHIDGRLVDGIAIAGNNTTNPVRRIYVDLDVTNVVDLAITPVGPTGDRGDGADGSSTWFWVDTRLPREPRQPDGSLFIPASSPDSDTDGLADFWERVYADNLTTFTGNGDNDADGLNNLAELQRDSNPLSGDTDGDGLSDSAETKTGTFVSATDTGTNPRRADTDGDGLSDSAEVNGNPSTNPNLADTDGDGFSDSSEINSGHNPNDPSNNPNTTSLANSFTEFSGVQGQENWYYGYRDFTADGGAASYDPVAHFIEFPSTTFTGTLWDLNTAAAAPWTEIGAEASHPNGPSPVHWTIRRWLPATEITEETPVALKWLVRKSNVNGGNGVTGGVYINGERIDSAVIGGTDGVGSNRTYYVVLRPTDIVDLIHSPTGADGDHSDGSDGSFLRLLVDTAIPPNPRQPDGTPFTGLSPQLLTPVYNNAAGTVTLRWRSRAGQTYAIDASPDLATWTQVANNVASAGAETSHVDTLPTPRPARRFYRIREL